jgi:hypothetical protein
MEPARFFFASIPPERLAEHSRRITLRITRNPSIRRIPLE